jgi:hypothetical protein
MAAQNKGWTKEQWLQQVELNQLAVQNAIDHLKENLSYCLRTRVGPWAQILDCQETLDQLNEALKTASWKKGWRANPVILTQQAIRQIRGSQASELDTFLMVLSLVLNNLTLLWEHSVR